MLEMFRAIGRAAETRGEINRARDLIEENARNVLMIAYRKNLDSVESNSFGPRGYDEDEIDAIKRELKESDRISVSGNDTGGVVTIMNRRGK